MVPVAKFFVSPQNNDTREIALLPNEILTEIVIPPAHGVKNATYEVRHKNALDWPLATASVALTMKGTKVVKASVVLGHVAPIPWAAAAADQALASNASFDDAAEAAIKDAKPLSQNAYKIQLAKVAVKRALNQATGRA
jgi:xanthine dehydrogenase YagS FAD-binding subunit